jgi:SAM-dependent methyltransferase
MIKKARFLNLVDKDYFPKSGKVLDIGCHIGNESRELLVRSFDVDGIDVQNLTNISDPLFHFFQSDIRDFKIQKDFYDLILAYYVLPFLRDEQTIQRVIKDIRLGLKESGIAIITLFGKEHEWYKSGVGKHIYFTFEEAKRIIGEYIYVEAKEGMSDTMNGQRIFWQSWDFVIRK